MCTFDARKLTNVYVSPFFSGVLQRYNRTDSMGSNAQPERHQWVAMEYETLVPQRWKPAR